MPQPTARIPTYLTRFRCIGSRCEDNCCAGWQHVDVDEASFEAYGRLDHPELGPAVRQHVLPNDDPAAAPDERALIAIPDGGCCPFFTPEGLCAIQRELGEALLPAGCDTFPRQATLVGDTLDVAAGFSCPEVVRLALLAPDALELLEVEPERRLRERGRYWVEVPWLDEPAEGDPRRHYHRVRGLCLDLLRRREVSLEARLQALGGALELLDAWPGLGADEIGRIFAEASARLPALQRAVWRRFNEAVAAGRIPHSEIIDGVLIIFGGAFLITPGFLTDVVGLLFLLPPTRVAFRRTVRRGIERGTMWGRIGGAAVRAGQDRREARRPRAGADGRYDVEGTATEVETESRRLEP